jgi:hypothetical protein
MPKTYETLNICLQRAFSSLNLLAEVTRCGSNELLVGNDGVGSTPTTPLRAQGMEHDIAMNGARRGMERGARWESRVARARMGYTVRKTSTAST